MIEDRRKTLATYLYSLAKEEIDRQNNMHGTTGTRSTYGNLPRYMK